MIVNTSIRPIGSRRAGCLNRGIVVRVALALAALSLAIVPTLASDRPTLRTDVVAKSDVLTLADLLDGVSGPLADRPLFRSPALGETGTIQARRIADQANELGLGIVDTAGRGQVVVTRAARRIAAGELEAALKRVLEMEHGIDARPLSIVFDGTPPSLVVAPEVKGAATAEDVVYDRRSRRISATVAVGLSPGERRASARVTGAVVEVVEVAVLNRSVAKGDTVQAADFALERRVKDSIPADVQANSTALPGQVARRPLTAGSVIRVGDVSRPEVVTKGEVVTIVYEVPGMVLTLRGKATESGAQGDSIAVLNPQSKKTLQAQIVAPGKVSVNAALPGRVASNPTPAQP